MQEKYEIRAALKTAAGYVEYCRFFLGSDPYKAKEIFHSLTGIIPETNNKYYILRMSLVCEAKSLKWMETRYCTLNELAFNCQMITKEIFKHLALQ